MASWKQMPMLDPRRREFTHEELFVERYDALLRAACRVTEGDRQAAEDLVQDAFIRFTLVQPPLAGVERLDAYFYAMLRNMHTSRVRRGGRAAEVSLSILDFDSLDIGLDALDASRRLEVRQAVYAACHYGCVRRHSSKVGSIFLLRFFHGYLPSEIASIARLSAAAVDERLFRARCEAKLFVQHPEQLAFMGADRAAQSPPSSALDTNDGSEEGLLRQLRAMMFSERHVPCWPTRVLRDLYRADRTEPLTREQLAALVGCPACLDEVNAILNIPKLATRWPTDTLGPGSRGGAGMGRSSPRLASARRRANAVFEHRPRQLRILVNGFELASHTIGSRQSELVLTVNVGEPIALVELFSEQGLCLLFLDAAPPPDGPVRQRGLVELSQGRHAGIEVTFGGPWPTVRASYFDPRTDVPVAADQRVADELPGGRDTRTSGSRTASWMMRLFGPRPAPAMLVGGALVVWLLFWTPFAEVSAADYIANTIKWLVAELTGSPRASSAPAPASGAPRPAPAVPIAREPAGRAAVARAPRLTDATRTALELKAIAQLQRVDAYLGQEVSFGPVSATQVHMRAAVDGERRKQAIESALASLVANRHVRAEIANLREMAGRLSPVDVQADTPAREFVFVKDQFAMFEPLRQYFRHQREYELRSTDAAAAIDDPRIDAEVRRFAIRIHDHARRASQHAWALKHLADHFAPEAIHTASAETQELWHSVLREHGRGYRHELALLRTTLEPIKASGLLDAELQGSPVEAETADTWVRIARLLDAQKSQDAAIQAAFAIRSDSAGVSLVQTRAFWRLLDQSDLLAAEIAGVPASH